MCFFLTFAIRFLLLMCLYSSGVCVCVIEHCFYQFSFYIISAYSLTYLPMAVLISYMSELVQRSLINFLVIQVLIFPTIVFDSSAYFLSNLCIRLIRTQICLCLAFLGHSPFQVTCLLPVTFADISLVLAYAPLLISHPSGYRIAPALSAQHVSPFRSFYLNIHCYPTIFGSWHGLFAGLTCPAFLCIPINIQPSRLYSDDFLFDIALDRALEKGSSNKDTVFRKCVIHNSCLKVLLTISLTIIAFNV